MIMFSLSLLPAQEMPYEQASALFGGQKIVKFRPFSLDMTDEGEEVMVQLAQHIMQYPRMIGPNLLIIQVFGYSFTSVVKDPRSLS